VGPCPPYKRDKQEGSRRSRPERRSWEARPPWPPCGATPARTGPSKTIPAITAITPVTAVTAVTARSWRGARRVTATRRDLAIAEAPGDARTPRSDPGSGPPSERNRLRPAGGAPTTPPSYLRPRGRKTPNQPTWQREPRAARRPASGRARRVYAADDCYNHSASTAFLVSGARPLPAAETATQSQERLRNALTTLHVSRAQKQRPRPVLPVSSTRRDDAGRRPRGPATEVNSQDGQTLSAAQVLPFADELSRVREDQAAVLLPVNNRERRGCESRPSRIGRLHGQ
jgi:hypothetical protein